MALGASVYKLVFDTQGLENVTASRRELALSKKIMEETTPVVDKLAAAEANLDRLVKKDLISHEQRNQALAKVKGELTESTTAVVGLNAAHLNGIPVVGKFSSTLAAVGPIGVAVAAAVGGVTIAAKLMSAAIHTTIENVSDQIEKIDKLIEASETIDIPVNQFQRLSHAADLADISQDSFTKGTEKMLTGISKGADGSKKLVDAFNILGLDAGKLRDMQPQEAFEKITKAMGAVPNAADKARAATAIFGSADFLRINTSQIEHANELFDKLGAGIDDVDTQVFNAMDDSVKDMNLALGETWKKLAMEIVPALGEAAEVATEWLINVNKDEKFTDTLATIGDTLAVIVATGRELPGVLDSWLPHLQPFIAAAKGTTGSGIATGIGNVAGSATADISEQVRRQRELDAKLRSIQDAGKPVVGEEDDGAESVTGLTKELEKQVKQLEDAVEYAGLAKEEIVLLKLAEAGASAAVRDAAQASASRIMQLQREEDAVKKLAKANEEAAKKAEDTEKRRQDAISDTIDNLDTQLDKLQMTEREQLEYSDALITATKAQVDFALAKFDSIKKLEKERDVTKLATDAIAEYEKRIRQANMTESERRVDDLRAAGVKESQLEIVETLQKELAIREGIKSTIEATSAAIKAGSREAADSLAQANQAAVLANFRGGKKGSESEPAAGEQVAVDKGERAKQEPLPVALPLRDPRIDAERAQRAREELEARLKAARESKDVFEDNETRARLMVQGNDKRIEAITAKEDLQNRLADTRAEKAVVDQNAREQIANRLNGVTATPQAAPPTIASPMIADQPGAKDQLKATEKTNAILTQISEKLAPAQIEEVTL